MAQVECFNCHHRWDLSRARSNRCPSCGWLTEIYSRREDADRAATIYNDGLPAAIAPSGVTPVVGMPAFAVAYSDQDRLLAVAGEMLDRFSE